MSYDLNNLLSDALKKKASDLHINAGQPPHFRIGGKLIGAHGQPLSHEDAQELCFEPLNQEQVMRLESDREIDLSFEIPNLGRFRVNVYYSLDGIAGVFRPIPFEIPDPKEMDIPAFLLEFAEKPSGLVLVTGPTGSGKSTTVAAMLEHVNKIRACHIITLEDPIEFVFQPHKSIISQREIEKDTLSFSRALKHALRQDPDILMIGGLYDAETILGALSAAETGHLVIATMRTNFAVQTIDRIVDLFPPHQQTLVRTQLSLSLKAIVSQRLIPNTKGGCSLATETLIPNDRIRGMIRDGKTREISAQIFSEKENSGIRTMDESIRRLIQNGKIKPDEIGLAL